MANLITIASFSNPYLPFAVVGEDSETILNEYITKHQAEYLKLILGIRTYNVFIAAYPDGGFWDDFVDGTTYTHNSVSYVFGGIKPVLTNFVYYHWHRYMYSFLGEKGALNPQYQKLVKVVPVDKMVSAYNEAVDLINNSVDYDATVYHYMDTQYTGTDWDYTKIEKINSFNV